MLDLLTITEKRNYELKLASNGVPKSIYETISAFANTDGGTIILGVEENRPTNKIVGVNNPEQYKKDILNTVHNKSKFSYPLLDDENFQILGHEGLKVLLINVPEAPKNLKPIYLNNNYFDSFGRSDEGDYHLTQSQIKYYLNDNSDDSYDLMPNVKKYGFEDVNISTLHNYRKELDETYPNNIFSALPDEEFLLKTGLLVLDENKAKVLTNAAVILLTDFTKITSIFPTYLLDYQRIVSNNSKWDNRIVSDEPTWSGNLFDFYQLVFADLYRDIPASYVSENGKNVGKSLMVDCFKEALANAFSNHSFYLSVPLKIVRTANELRVRNSGKMLVDKSRAILGGISKVRNQGIITFFRRIGVADRTGTGIPEMFSAMEKNGYQEPQLIEESLPEDYTTLVLSFTSKTSVNNEIENKLISYVRSLGDLGASITQIAEHLNVSRQYASTLVSKLIKENILMDNNKLTKGRLIFVK